MSDWQKIVYGGCKTVESDGKVSKNVHAASERHSAPETNADGNLDVPITTAAIVACRQKIDLLREKGFSWGDIGKVGGVPRGTAWNYGHGKARPTGDFVLRIVNFRNTQHALAVPCPTCGRVHGEGLDCHGRPVADVVILRPGQRVVTSSTASVKRRPRKRRASIHVSPGTWAKLNEARQAAGLTWEEFLSKLT